MIRDVRQKMKTPLRLLSVIVGLLSLLFLAGAVSIVIVTKLAIRDVLAAAFFLAVSIVSARSVVWVWSGPSFWKFEKKRADVVALLAFLAAVPFVIAVERHASLVARDVAYGATVVLTGTAYGIARRSRSRS